MDDAANIALGREALARGLLSQEAARECLAEARSQGSELLDVAIAKGLLEPSAARVLRLSQSDMSIAAPPPPTAPKPPSQFRPPPRAFSSSSQALVGLPPGAPSYGGAPTNAAYGAQPPVASAYGEPPTDAALGAQPPGAPSYGGPPTDAAYGAPPGGASAYGTRSGSSAFGAQPSGSAYGAPPGSSPSQIQTPQFGHEIQQRASSGAAFGSPHSGSSAGSIPMLGAPVGPGSQVGHSSGLASGDSMTLPSVGEVVDGYEIVSELGRGGMGAVFKARRAGGVFAVKFILTEDEQARARFRREAEAIAKVDRHPNIVGIHSYSQHGLMPYLVLDYIEGKGLDSLIGDKPLPLKRALDIVATVAEALDSVHRAGILHRDIKPANIIIRNDDGAPMLTDFGLARAGDSEALTKTSDFLGTPDFMSPEQAGSEHALVGPRSDVWGLAAVLYQLCTGQKPFRGDTIIGTVKDILTRDPTPPRKLEPKLPIDVETIILKGLAKELEDRYQSAGEFAADCHRALAGESIAGERLGFVASTRRRMLRRFGKRALIAIGVGVLLAVMAGIGVTVATQRWQQRSAQRKALTKQLGEELQKSLALLDLAWASELTKFLPKDWRPEFGPVAPFLAQLAATRQVLNKLATVDSERDLSRPKGSLALMSSLGKLSDAATALPIDRWSLERVLLDLARGHRALSAGDAAKARRFMERARGAEAVRWAPLAGFACGLVAILEAQPNRAAACFARAEKSQDLAIPARALRRRCLLTHAVDAAFARVASRDLVKSRLAHYGQLFGDAAKATLKGWQEWNQAVNKGIVSGGRPGTSLTTRAIAYELVDGLRLKFGLRPPEIDQPLTLELYQRAIRANDPRRTATFYYRLKSLDPRFESKQGFRDIELIKTVQYFSRKSKDEIVSAFYAILAAARSGKFPWYMFGPGFLAKVRSYGILDAELTATPNDSYLHFFRAMSFPAQRSRTEEAELYSRRVSSQIDDYQAVIDDPRAQTLFKAVATCSQVQLRRIRAMRLSLPPDEKTAGQWRKALDRALALHHPAPDEVARERFLLESALLRAQGRSIASAIPHLERALKLAQDRHRRSLAGSLGEGRPPKAPLSPLATNAVDIQCGRIIAQLIRAYSRTKNPRGAARAGRKLLKDFKASPYSPLAASAVCHELISQKHYPEAEVLLRKYWDLDRSGRNLPRVRRKLAQRLGHPIEGLSAKRKSPRRQR